MSALPPLPEGTTPIVVFGVSERGAIDIVAPDHLPDVALLDLVVAFGVWLQMYRERQRRRVVSPN